MVIIYFGQPLPHLYRLFIIAINIKFYVNDPLFCWLVMLLLLLLCLFHIAFVALNVLRPLGGVRGCCDMVRSGYFALNIHWHFEI